MSAPVPDHPPRRPGLLPGQVRRTYLAGAAGLGLCVLGGTLMGFVIVRELVFLAPGTVSQLISDPAVSVVETVQTSLRDAAAGIWGISAFTFVVAGVALITIGSSTSFFLLRGGNISRPAAITCSGTALAIVPAIVFAFPSFASASIISTLVTPLLDLSESQLIVVLIACTTILYTCSVGFFGAFIWSEMARIFATPPQNENAS